MVKMYVGDEEVLCDKSFEISEELLNTSSLILNNVFPKKWDEEKKYTQFWFPKDYSKFKLYDIPKELDDPNYKIIEGNTTQDGIPSDDNPIDMESVTGIQNITLSGKTYQIDLTGIYLNGIEGHNDYIYYKDNKWYIHRACNEIGYDSISDLNNSYYYEDKKLFVVSESKSYTTVGGNYSTDTFCNYLERASFSYLWLYSNISGIGIGYGDADIGYYLLYYLRNLSLTSVDDLRTWLDNRKDIKCIYVLLNPYEEEITLDNYPNLFKNLESIKKLVFCGAVKNTNNITLNPRYPHYCSLQILDFKELLSQGETLDFVISNKTIRQAIEMVINAIKDYGFILGNININGADDIIGAYSTQEKTAYDVFQYICDITQSKWTTRMIDENTIAIDFFDPLLKTKAENIEYNNNYFETHNIENMEYNYSMDDYRNKQVIISNEVYGNVDFTNLLFGDGYAKEFTLENNIAVVKSILVNGESKTFATENEIDLGIEADFSYKPSGNTIKSLETDPYTAGTQIQIVYTPLIYGRQVVRNSNEISRISSSINRKGIIARYETRNDSRSTDELEKIGESYIKYKGSAEITLKVKSDDYDLFNIADITSLVDCPLQELNIDYMVKSKKISYIATTGNIFYTYELTSSFNSENAINFFDNQRSKNAGNIEEGQFITRNADIDSTTNIIFENLQVKEIEINHNNILNAPLNFGLTK